MSPTPPRPDPELDPELDLAPSPGGEPGHGHAAGAWTIRPTRPGDVEALNDLTEAVAAEGRWLGTEAGFDREARARRLVAALREPDRWASFVAVRGPDPDASGTALVGNLGIERQATGVATLGMQVADGWRGRGIGTALLRSAVDWARDHDAHKVQLEVWPHNRAAIALYERTGFVVEGRLARQYRRRSGELWDSLVMGLVLDTTSPGSPHG